jgi:hypothetical protein
MNRLIAALVLATRLESAPAQEFTTETLAYTALMATPTQLAPIPEVKAPKKGWLVPEETRVRIRVDVVWGFGGENVALTPVTGDVGASTTVYVDGTDYGTVQTFEPFVLGSFDGVVDGAGPSGRTFLETNTHVIEFPLDGRESVLLHVPFGLDGAGLQPANGIQVSRSVSVTIINTYRKP